MTTNQTHYDTIVVGSGPGGASVAKALTDKGANVLILEWGTGNELNGSMIKAIPSLGIFGKNILIADKTGLAMVRGTCTGGSSVFYCATAVEPPYDMLDKYGIDIRNETEEVKKEVPVAPLKDELIGPTGKVLMKSARELGYNWQKLNKFIYQDKCQLGCDKCNYGCPYGAKWSGRNYVIDAVQKGAEIFNKAKVTTVLFENNKAVGVEYTHKRKPHKVYADNIVVAAGGIGSPELLRHSGLYGAGYDFFYDPLNLVFGELKGLGSHGEPQMAGGLHDKEGGFMLTDLAVAHPAFMALTAPKLKAHRVFKKSDTMSVMVKVRDDLGGRITWKGGVRKGLADSDKQKLENGSEHAAKILKNAGATKVYQTTRIAAHPGGTVKINDMLDSDLKTEKDNLYVCDCSVIPEAWGLPPTLTLAALGKRLANHIGS